MTSKVTALEETKGAVEASLRLKLGSGEFMAAQLRTSYEPWHTYANIMVKRGYEHCKWTPILIQITCVASIRCPFPCLSHVRPSTSPITSTLKTQLVRRRRAQARPLLSVGETLEDFGQESLDDGLTRRFCEGRLSALQSARGAAAAVRPGAQDDRVVAVAKRCKSVLTDAQRSMLRRALR